MTASRPFGCPHRQDTGHAGEFHPLTSFVERHDGTDRGRCSRTGRKSYEFSKDWDTHVAATRFRYFRCNFCRPVRTLRVKGADGK